MHDKQRNRDKNDKQAFFQQLNIGNLALRIEAHNFLLQLWLRLEFLAIKHDQERLDDKENHDGHAG